ncbi:hypothetical protein BDZ89DRAFT_545060 [Hymenopellis radicata]|nr:hypothetical protein BDZ89DRAFT_545060 [Hymenopellis radicata]
MPGIEFAERLIFWITAAGATRSTWCRVLPSRTRHPSRSRNLTDKYLVQRCESEAAPELITQLLNVWFFTHLLGRRSACLS